VTARQAAADGPPALDLRLLGPPEVALGGRPVRLRRRAAGAVLAYLALTGRPQRREALAALIAGDAGAAQADRRLSNALAELRTALGAAGAVRCDLELVALDPACPLRSDVDALQGAAAAAVAGDPAADGALVALDRGELLEGLDLPDAPAFQEWLLLQREHLRGVLTHALQAALDRRVRRGATADSAEAVALARRLLLREPWREEAHRALMVLLARAGQRTAALAQYEACRRSLAAELGVQPEAPTRALRARLVHGPAPIPHNLPAPPAPLLGREAELARLTDRLADPDCRLVTLTGLGGSGKTRLALEAAARFVAPGDALADPPFPDGVFVVPLAGGAPNGAGEADAPDDAGLGAALRRALGATGPAADEWAALAGRLRSRRLLLVLDGLDAPEVTARAGALLPPLLRRAPGVTILVTSRARLGLRGQTRIDVRGLPLPARPEDLDGSPAGACLLRAAGAGGAAPPAEADRAAAAAVCRAVDGLPLALELAAGCLPGMAWADLAAELHRGGAALDLLGAPDAGRPPRQRGVRPILEDAWARLSEAERAVVRGLTPFGGAFTRAAASDVAGASAAQLVALVDAGVLLRADTRDPAGPGPGGAGGRYRLPGLVRAFARERLAEHPDEARGVRRRYAAYAAARSPRPPPFDTATGREAGWAGVPETDALALGPLRGRSPAPPHSLAGPPLPGGLGPPSCWQWHWHRPVARPPAGAGRRPRPPPPAPTDRAARRRAAARRSGRRPTGTAGPRARRRRRRRRRPGSRPH
jgi:DNA-binding SARP family transcriptional activator/predicted ATPase